jgi:hypothetical protein
VFSQKKEIHKAAPIAIELEKTAVVVSLLQH